MNRERARLLLAQGQLDVIWSSSTAQREALYAPARFNLLKSINEYRVLLIRRQDRERFAAIRTREQLLALRAGAGEHWSDAQIMRNNGLQVVTAARHESLYPMLERGRFDFLPRALNELLDEQSAIAGRDLEHEQTLFLHYPHADLLLRRQGQHEVGRAHPPGPGAGGGRWQPGPAVLLLRRVPSGLGAHPPAARQAQALAAAGDGRLGKR